MIQLKQDGYYVMSKDGSKELGGPYKSEEDAEVRMRQVEFFKKFGKGDGKVPSGVKQPKASKG